MDKQTNLAKIFEFVLKFKTGKIILRIFGRFASTYKVHASAEQINLLCSRLLRIFDALIVPEVRVNVHVGGRTGRRKVAVE